VFKKIESYRVTHNGVIPVIPSRGESEVLALKPRPGRVGRGDTDEAVGVGLTRWHGYLVRKGSSNDYD